MAFLNLWRLRRVPNRLGQSVHGGDDLAKSDRRPADPGQHPFDRETSIDTSGYLHGSQLSTGHPHDQYSHGYYGTAPSLIVTVLQAWRATAAPYDIEDYTFVDLGSGKGRVLLLASELPFHACIGVELSPKLHGIAERNAKVWLGLGRSISPIYNLCQDVTEFTFPEGPCVLYLFHPFSAQVLVRLLDNIEAAFADRPNEVDLLYVNAEYQQEFERRPSFQLLWRKDLRMSAENAAADLLYSTDDQGRRLYAAEQESCCTWRFVGEPFASDGVDRERTANVA